MAETADPVPETSAAPGFAPAAVAGALIAVQAFGLAASGSLAVFAVLICSVLDLAAWAGLMTAARWAGPDVTRRRRAEATAGVFHAGLTLASAAFLGWEAVMRVFRPQALVAGEWGVLAILIAMAVSGLVLTLRRRPSSEPGPPRHEEMATELAPSLVALIGVASGTWLAAPGLDASAAMVIAVWLAWGALSQLRASLRGLAAPPTGAGVTVNGG